MADIASDETPGIPIASTDRGADQLHRNVLIGLALVLVIAPFVAYPVFVMKGGETVKAP